MDSKEKNSLYFILKGCLDTIITIGGVVGILFSIQSNFLSLSNEIFSLHRDISELHRDISEVKTEVEMVKTVLILRNIMPSELAKSNVKVEEGK
jgi:hypothetical protein